MSWFIKNKKLHNGCKNIELIALISEIIYSDETFAVLKEFNTSVKTSVYILLNSEIVKLFTGKNTVYAHVSISPEIVTIRSSFIIPNKKYVCSLDVLDVLDSPVQIYKDMIVCNKKCYRADDFKFLGNMICHNNWYITKKYIQGKAHNHKNFDAIKILAGDNQYLAYLYEDKLYVIKND